MRTKEQAIQMIMDKAHATCMMHHVPEHLHRHVHEKHEVCVVVSQENRCGIVYDPRTTTFNMYLPLKTFKSNGEYFELVMEHMHVMFPRETEVSEG